MAGSLCFGRLPEAAPLQGAPSAWDLSPITSRRPWGSGSLPALPHPADPCPQPRSCMSVISGAQRAGSGTGWGGNGCASCRGEGLPGVPQSRPGESQLGSSWGTHRQAHTTGAACPARPGAFETGGRCLPTRAESKPGLRAPESGCGLASPGSCSLWDGDPNETLQHRCTVRGPNPSPGS